MEEDVAAQIPVKIIVRHDWKKLKMEFLAGDYSSVSEFFRQKKIALSSLIRAKGWLKEREEIRKNAILTATQKSVEAEMEAVGETRLRQARTAKFLQLKGIAKLQDLDPMNIEDARKLIVSGLEQERRALGLEGGGTQNLTQININPKTNIDKMLEKLDYAGILELVADIRRERARKFGIQAPEVSPGEAGEDRAE